MPNSTPNVWDALRDLLQFHFGSNASWLPALLWGVAVVAILVLLYGIYPVPPFYRSGLLAEAAICWAVSTVCAYAAGFIVARLRA
jgi:hypothetical protein